MKKMIFLQLAFVSLMMGASTYAVEVTDTESAATEASSSDSDACLDGKCTSMVKVDLATESDAQSKRIVDSIMDRNSTPLPLESKTDR